MRVVTMNVFAHHRDWEERRPILIDGMARIAPDVAVLQEIVVTDGYDQAQEILGAAYQVHHQPGRSADGVGATVASRWPLRVVLEIGLDDGHASWIGSLVVARVHAPDPVGTMFIAHYKPTWVPADESARERQAVRAARELNRLLDRQLLPLVLAGDFDAPPEAASIRFLTGRQSLDGISVKYHDAWEVTHPGEAGHTFSPANGIRSDRWRPRAGERIDYVMVRGGEHGAPLDVTDCELAFDQPVDGTWASDHFAVVADLEPVPETGGHP
jgi:endonuclease/exonuclease/phosphatase family metal-dependent hydrolase